jgi:hypothetical protein
MSTIQPVAIWKLDFLIPATAVFFLGWIAYELFNILGDPTLGGFSKPTDWKLPESFPELKARTQWILLMGISLGSTAIVACGFCTRVIYRCIYVRSPDVRIGVSSLQDVFPSWLKAGKAVTLTLFIYVAIACFATHSIVRGLGSGDRYLGDYISAMFLHTVVNTAHTTTIAALAQSLFPVVDWTIAILTVLIMLAISATSAGWLKLVPDISSQADIDRFNTVHLTPNSAGNAPAATRYEIELYGQAERLDYLRRVIYAGSVVQALVAVALGAFFNRATSGLDLLQHLRGDSIGQVYVIRFAGISSVMLVSAYIISATILGWRARRLVPYFDPTGKMISYGQRQFMMVQLGVDPQISQHMASVLMSLTPIVTGTLLTAISGISV